MSGDFPSVDHPHSDRRRIYPTLCANKKMICTETTHFQQQENYCKTIVCVKHAVKVARQLKAAETASNFKRCNVERFSLHTDHRVIHLVPFSARSSFHRLFVILSGFSYSGILSDTLTISRPSRGGLWDSSNSIVSVKGVYDLRRMTEASMCCCWRGSSAMLLRRDFVAHLTTELRTRWAKISLITFAGNGTWW